MHFLRKTTLYVASYLLKRRQLKTTFYVYGSLVGVKNLSSNTMAKSASCAPNAVLKRIDNIIKSDEDKREYRGLILSNNMKVLLVSDPTTDKSAAAMDVNVGFMSDPKELPGLAHFCEHMLFLGTEKYPDENDYSKFLSTHNGSSNAATYSDHTIYYFDINPDKLENALDRFAQFFLNPLFTEGATERELNAVNLEHEKNIASDVWRLDQLDKHTADPNHAYNSFGTGNKYTLEGRPKEMGINVRERLLEFHGKWYSANMMCLGVLGKESLDEMEEMVVNKFADVVDKSAEIPNWPEPPFKAEHLGSCVYVAPIKDIRSLNLVFPLDDMKEFYRSSPTGYISHLIGHEGPGSILSALKARGWCNNLVAGTRSDQRDFSFFGIGVDLTEEGVEHTDDIIKLIFQYINMLKNQEPEKWIQEESRDICQMVFRFKDKESPRTYISSMVHQLQDYPIEHILCSHYMLDEWRPDLIKNILNSFVPKNVRVAVTAQCFENKLDETEPWYGTKYKKVSLDEKKMKEWLNAGVCNELKLPPKNEFIPTDFTLYPLDEETNEYPVIIQDTALTRVWFKQDDKFFLPKAHLMFDFVSPMAYLDPINCNLTHMLVQLFRDSLNEYAYAAELAGLKWELINTKYGLILAIGGYSSKQHLFLDKVMKKLTEFKIDPKRFAIYKETYIRTLKNFSMEQPYQHAVYYLTVLLTEHSWTKKELLAAADQITLEKLEAFIPQILSKMHIECLIHGNVNEKKALELVQTVEDRLTSTLNMSPLLPRQLLLNRELKLENGCHYLYQVENDVHKSSCIELYYQCGIQSKESNMKLELLAQIIQEPCFNILRTKEQLGYIVFSGVRRSNGVQGLRIIVQSDRHPTYLDVRIETFLDNMLDTIEKMSDDEFNKHREALAAHRLEKPKQLSSQTTIYWSEITSQQYHFDRANVEVAYLRTITKGELMEFFERLIKNGATERKKLSLHVVSMVEGGAGVKSDEETKQITSDAKNLQDVTEFKSSHEMYPLVQPYITITRKGNKCKL